MIVRLKAVLHFVVTWIILSLPAISVALGLKSLAFGLAVAALVGIALLWIWKRSQTIFVELLSAKLVESRSPLGQCFLRAFPHESKIFLYEIPKWSPFHLVLSAPKGNIWMFISKGSVESMSEMELIQHWKNQIQPRNSDFVSRWVQWACALRFLFRKQLVHRKGLFRWFLAWTIHPLDRFLGISINSSQEAFHNGFQTVAEVGPYHLFPVDIDSSIASVRGR